MDNDQFTLAMTALLRIADALERIAPATPKAPNYQYPIEAFPNFDWESIGAVVVQEDQYGAGVVSWGGKDWLRRSPANKYGAAIWFSRANGQDDEGKAIYERLITFKPRNTSVEPIPQKVANLINFEKLA
jgi:DdrB-like protein